ncbi:major facilitator superfamily domain-containing protein [Dactylonectria estremocensis]|uniref:Major facilitator superfamily domain-containing protein n=1 Tax=Dactylonectria estremocensis TaxID=1079267 RepID=A0A9P9F8G2_9HYPO|nr:major facilitator superfamily domain-containing protein [Dactylonectria estremocensis]
MISIPFRHFALTPLLAPASKVVAPSCLLPSRLCPSWDTLPYSGITNLNWTSRGEMDEKRDSADRGRERDTGSPDTSTLNDGDAITTIQPNNPRSFHSDIDKASPVQLNEPPPPPNGGYGWVCTASVATINAHTWGLNSSYGVFLAHYLQNNTYPGATSLEYAFIGSLSVSCALLISPVATLAVREFGTKPTLFFGVVLETASLICASFAYKIWHLFLSQGILFGLGMGFLFVPSVGIVPQWFTTRRSLANGISAAGSGLGGLLYSFASGAMIKNLGLAWAFRILGIIVFVVNTACVLLVKDRNKIIGSRQAPFDIALFKRAEYLLLLGYGWFSMLGYIVLIFSLANYANEVGLDASQAALVSAIFNLGQAFGRPFIGYFSDRTGRINMAGLTTFMAAVFVFSLWINGTVYGVLILFTIVGGAVGGTFWATIAPVTAEVVGLADVPAALNLVWLVIVLPCTFSEPIALEIVAKTGKYIGAQLFTGFMYIAATMCLVLLRGWKIGEIEEIARVTHQAPENIDRVMTANSEVVSVKSKMAGRKRMFAECRKPGRV